MRFHQSTEMVSLLTDKTLLVASLDGEILAAIEFANGVTTFEWWKDDLLVSAGSELFWLAWEKGLPR